MNRKNFFIFVLSTIVLAIIALGAFYFTEQSSAINPINIDGSKYIGLDTKETIKHAIENYLTQDNSESISSRNERLSLYFAGDSPVYKNPLYVVGSSVNKSVAKATNIELSDQPMGEYKIAAATVTITLYSNGKTSEIMDDYEIRLVKTADDKYVVYDLGKI